MSHAPLQEKVCLKCRQTFKSHGPFDRLCLKCEMDNDKLGLKDTIKKNRFKEPDK